MILVRRRLRILLAACCCVAGLCGSAFAQANPFGDLRALWISRFDYTASSASNINTVIDDAASLGITDVVFQVRGRADAFYNGSIYEPKATAAGGIDPLQIAIDRAHSHGMKLHAWTNAMPLWNLPDPPATNTVQNPSLHPFNAVPNPTAANPGFRVIDKFGNPEPGNGWSNYAMFNPASQATHDHINNVLGDIATRYDVDGIHLDYIRYGVNQSVSGETPFNRLPHDDLTHQMYSTWAQAKYPSQPGTWDGSNYANATPYREFITERITDMVGSIKDTIDDVELSSGREIALSAAVWRNPNIGKADYMQDYRTWLERDYLDIAMPMMYLSASNDHLMLTDLPAVMGIETNAKIAPGLGVYLHTASNGGVDLTITQLQRLYDYGADGATFYHYPSFFEGSLAEPRRTAVTNWYNNLPAVGEPGPGNVLDDFEAGHGHFKWPWNHSPGSQTFGLAEETSVSRVTNEAQGGATSQLLNFVIENPSDPEWQQRHSSSDNSQAAHPSGNVPLAPTGYVGFWLKTSDPNAQVRIAIDDPVAGGSTAIEWGYVQDVLADDEWHLYQWNLQDGAHWDPFGNAGSNGIIDAEGGTITIDSIWFNGSGNAAIYLDTVSHNPDGPLAAAVTIPGDYYGDGAVDASDYDTWIATLGQQVALGIGADGNGDGTVDAADYVVWRKALSTAGSSPLSDAPAVPEPSGLLLLATATFLLGLKPRRTA